MNSDALTYLLEIAETGSFNKAAQNLFISQPAIRSTISKLENDIGAPLLNRTKYGCTLTPLGEKVVSEAPIVLNYFQSWKDFAASSDNTRNEIIIYATKPFCSTVLSPIAANLQLQYPNLKFIIRSGNYSESIAMLRKAQCQMAIIHADLIDEDSLRTSLHLDDKYCIDQVMENNFLTLLNKSNPLCNKETLISSDLEPYTFISVSSLEMLTNQNFLQTGFQATRSLFFDSHNSIYQAINNNPSYYSLLTSIFLLTEDYKIYPNVCFKSISDLNYHSAFFLIYPKAIKSPVIYYIRKAINTFCGEITCQCLQTTDETT